MTGRASSAVGSRMPEWPSQIFSTEEALGPVWENCWREAELLRRYAAALLGNAHIAEDVAQEVFLRLLTALRAGCRIANRRAWLWRVTRNACLTRVLRQRWQAELEAGTGPQAAFNPEAAYQFRFLVRELLRTLTPRERACVRLRAEGFQYREIAQRLGIRPGTVAALLHRAGRKCRAAWQAPPPKSEGRAPSARAPAAPLQAASTGTADRL